MIVQYDKPESTIAPSSAGPPSEDDAKQSTSAATSWHLDFHFKQIIIRKILNT